MRNQLRMVEWVLLASGVLAGALGAILLKMGARSLNLNGGTWASQLVCAIRTPSILLGLLLYLIPTVLWIWLLRTIPLTVLQPILSLSYVLTALLALWILHEPVPLQRWLGMGLIMMGILMVSRS